MPIKEDCFAYINKKECKALNDLYCKNEKCKFYMTKEQYYNKFNISKKE